MVINQNQSVRYISVKVKENVITGLKLIDTNEEVIAEHTWGSKMFGHWVT